MSIGLLGAFGLMLSVLLAISQIKSSCARFCIPFGLCFGRKPSVSHLQPFGCKYFVLKHENLDKFESHSSDDILLGYTPHGRSYRVFNLETNTVVESCDVTFDETASYPRDVFECVGDKKIEESIFVDKKL
jgi:hypothetical protein